MGWDNTIRVDQSDKVILAFLEKMLVDGEVLPEAVSSVTNEFRLYLDPVDIRYYTMGAI